MKAIMIIGSLALVGCLSTDPDENACRDFHNGDIVRVISGKDSSKVGFIATTAWAGPSCNKGYVIQQYNGEQPIKATGIQLEIVE